MSRRWYVLTGFLIAVAIAHGCAPAPPPPPPAVAKAAQPFTLELWIDGGYALVKTASGLTVGGVVDSPDHEMYFLPTAAQISSPIPTENPSFFSINLAKHAVQIEGAGSAPVTMATRATSPCTEEGGPFDPVMLPNLTQLAKAATGGAPEIDMTKLISQVALAGGALSVENVEKCWSWKQNTTSYRQAWAAGINGLVYKKDMTDSVTFVVADLGGGNPQKIVLSPVLENGKHIVRLRLGQRNAAPGPPRPVAEHLKMFYTLLKSPVPEGRQIIITKNAPAAGPQPGRGGAPAGTQPLKPYRPGDECPPVYFEK